MKMLTNYRIAAALSAALFIGNAEAQDTLQFRNGKSTIANITEITSTLVKYKKADAPDGPLYSDLKNDIAQVKYINGSIEKFDYTAPVVPQAKLAKVTDKGPALRLYGHKAMYGEEVMGYRELQRLLINCNDNEISGLMRTARKQARAQYVGFGFFPLAIVGGYLASTDGPFTEEDRIVNGSIVGALAVGCFATSITLKAKRTRNEKKAIKLYQQRF